MCDSQAADSGKVSMKRSYKLLGTRKDRSLPIVTQGLSPVGRLDLAEGTGFIYLLCHHLTTIWLQAISPCGSSASLLGVDSNLSRTH